MIKTARDKDIHDSYYQAGARLALQQTGLLKLAREGDGEPTVIRADMSDGTPPPESLDDY